MAEKKPATKKTTRAAATKKTSATKKAAPRRPRAKKTEAAQVTYEQIACRAFELYERGAPGDALEHWLAAERELDVAA